MKAVLLINLGTPDSTSTSDVRRYLKEFLSDPRVISFPAAIRWFFLRLVILPFRPKKSAAAYRKVWLPEGSPLLVHSLKIAENLQKLYPDDTKVFLAMRYGKPGIRKTICQILLGNFSELKIVPLFPQYSSAANGSAIEEVFTRMKTSQNFPAIKVISHFYSHPAFIEAFAKNISEARFAEEFILFSYHGLPEQHCKRSDPSGGYCLQSVGCCLRKSVQNRFCYRHHCFETTRLIVEKLGLKDSQYATTFQSRLGPVPWIQPFTDEYISELYARGIKRLLVVSPSFVADCLETLEELQIRLREDWLKLGGEELKLVPSLNGNWALELKEILDQ